MPDFVEKDTGKTVTLEGAEAQAAYLSGQYGLPHGDVPLVAPDGGAPGLVSSTDVADALQQGYRFAHPDEVHHAKVEAEYGGVGGMVGAGLAGVARGLTIGTSDKALTDGGGSLTKGIREHLAGWEEANPGISLGGELVGAIAPAILTRGESALETAESIGARALEGGGEAAARAAEATEGLGGLAKQAGSAAAKAAAAPTEIVASAGRATERAVTSALGTSAGAKVAAKAAGAATEGAIYGAGAQVSEDAIGDHETTAEKLLASGLHGALLGGITGGALSATGEIGSSLLGRGASAIKGAADEQYFRALSTNKKGLVEEAKEKFGGIEPVVGYLRDRGVVQAGDDLSSVAAKASKADIANLEQLEARVQEVGASGVRLKDVLDSLEKRARQEEKILGHGDAAAAIRKQADDLSRIYEERLATAERKAQASFDLSLAPSETQGLRGTKALEIRHRMEPLAIDPDAGLADVGEAGWRIDEHGVPRMHEEPPRSPIVIDRTRPGHIGDGVMINPKMSEGTEMGLGGIGMRDAYDVGIKPGALTEEAAALRKPIKITKNIAASERAALEARSSVEIPFRELLDQRRSLERTINWQTDSMVAQGRKAAGRIIEDAIMNAGDEAAAKSGRGLGAWREAYQDAKKQFSVGRWVRDTTEDALTAQLRNRKLSPSDMAAGLAGMVGGAAHGAVGGVGGLAMGLVHHVIRERGNSTAAVVLDRLSALKGLQRAAASVDREVDRGIAGILRPGDRVPSVRRGNPYRDHQDRAEAVARAVVNLDDHTAAIEHSASKIAPHAPKTAAAYQSAALRATQWLAQQIPASMKRPPDPVMPQFDEAYVSPSDAASFVRKFDAVHDPASVLDDMRSGRVTTEQVQAIRAVYPSLYREITQKISDSLRTAKVPPSYEARKQISILFGIPADPTFSPGFVRSMQTSPGSSSPQTGAPKTTPSGSPKRKIEGLAEAAHLPGQASGTK